MSIPLLTMIEILKLIQVCCAWTLQTSIGSASIWRDIFKHLKSGLSSSQTKGPSLLFKSFKDIWSRLKRFCKNLAQVRKGLYSMSAVDLLNLVNVYAKRIIISIWQYLHNVEKFSRQQQMLSRPANFSSLLSANEKHTCWMSVPNFFKNHFLNGKEKRLSQQCDTPGKP